MTQNFLSFSFGPVQQVRVRAVSGGRTSPSWRKEALACLGTLVPLNGPQHISATVHLLFKWSSRAVEPCQNYHDYLTAFHPSSSCFISVHTTHLIISSSIQDFDLACALALRPILGTLYWLRPPSQTLCFVCRLCLYLFQDLLALVASEKHKIVCMLCLLCHLSHLCIEFGD